MRPNGQSCWQSGQPVWQIIHLPIRSWHALRPQGREFLGRVPVPDS